MIYRGRLLLDHDSATKPDVQITSDVAPEGYRHLMAPVAIHIVGKTVIRWTRADACPLAGGCIRTE